MTQFLLGVAAAIALTAIAGLAAVQGGAVDFAADSPHPATVTRFIAWAREQSVARQAGDIVPPADLADPERSRRGAGNYEAMCAGCHLSPGADDSEIRKGLYPAPPNLSLAAAAGEGQGGDARRFWIVKHGIKGSGMPAWARGGMDDAAIWDLVAFIRVLPQLSASEYEARVAASDGHAHAGVESPPAAPAAVPGHRHEGHAHGHRGHKP